MPDHEFAVWAPIPERDEFGNLKGYKKSKSGETVLSAANENALSELAQAGMSSVTFTLLIPSGSPLTSQEAQFIQSELQPAGITANIKQETFATLLSDTDSHCT